ncbi:MAG: ATPase [Treponema sp.]|jgi:hypothetical protein|nr:ATPase [Treponema sp.]
MEELQSTEILDREILEDARKKALCILKNADDTILSQNAEWEKKTLISIEELQKRHNEQLEYAAIKIMARLPIDKRRAKVEKIDSLLRTAVASWYKLLSRETILDLLTEELSKRLAVCREFAVSVQKHAVYSGLDRHEAEMVFKRLNIDCSVEESSGSSHYPSIILETESVRITASIKKMTDHYIHVKRTELVETLVGRSFAGETIETKGGLP